MQETTVFKFEVVVVDSYGNEIQRNRAQAQSFKEALGHGIALDMVQIPAGGFYMGSPATECDRVDDEGPQQHLTLPSFFIGRTPITQAQWATVALLPKINRHLDPAPWHFVGSNRPVESISWHDAIEFCARLTQYTKRGYRLPSEAEWEYACRAKTITPFYFGEAILPSLAIYSCQATAEVGSPRSANAFGLQDMHGNVWEWCSGDGSNIYLSDSPEHWSIVHQLEDGFRPLRGGAWNSPARFCRSATRFFQDAHSQHCSFGFRVVCTSMDRISSKKRLPTTSQSILDGSYVGGNVNIQNLIQKIIISPTTEEFFDEDAE